MSLYANNICKAISRISQNVRQVCRLGGVICNSRNLPDEEKLVGAFASEVGSKIAYIEEWPGTHTELNNQTVIEFAPDSPLSATYQSLPKK